MRADGRAHPSRQCRRVGCPQRAVRAHLCAEHYLSLCGDAPAPYPCDLEPKSWREKQHRRMYGTAP